MFSKKLSLSKEEFFEILLSHHPNTPEFEGDIIRIGKHRICEGCLIGWSVAILFFLINPVQNELYLPLAFIFMFTSLLRKLWINKYFKYLCKFFAGLAMGAGFRALDYAILTLNYLNMILLALGVVIYSIFRIYKLKKGLEKANLGY